MFFPEHKTIAQEETNVSNNHNLCESDLIWLAETRLLKTEDSKECAIKWFNDMLINDQTWNTTERPSHGLLGYEKYGWNVLEQHSYQAVNFKALNEKFDFKDSQHVKVCILWNTLWA